MRKALRSATGLVSLVLAVVAAGPTAAAGSRQEQAAVVDYLFNAQVVSFAVAAESDLIVKTLRARLASAQSDAKQGRLDIAAARQTITELKAELITAAERDRTRAAAIATIRAQAEDLASTPEGLEILERYNAGARRQALADADAIAQLSALKTASLRRNAASLAKSSLADGDDDDGPSGETSGKVLQRYLDVVVLDPGRRQDWLEIVELASQIEDYPTAETAIGKAIALSADDHERAQAEQRLGDLQIALGRDAEGEMTLTHAIARLDDWDRRERTWRPGSSGASAVSSLAYLAWTRGDTARAEALFQDALARVSDNDPDGMDTLEALYAKELARFYADEERYAEARAVVTRMEAHCCDDEEDDFDEGMSWLAPYLDQEHLVADIEAGEGDLDAALYRRQDALLTALDELENQRNVTTWDSAASELSAYAGELTDAGRLSEAIVAQRGAVEAYRRSIAFDPDELQQTVIADELITLSSLYDTVGDRRAAAAAAAEALVIAQGAERSRPWSPGILFTLADAYQTRALQAEGAGDDAAAVAGFSAALAVSQRLAALPGEAEDVDPLVDQADDHAGLARIALRAGDAAGARKHLELAQARYDAVLKGDPECDTALIAKAGALSAWGQLHDLEGGLVEARNAYEGALEILRMAVVEPYNPVFVNQEIVEILGRVAVARARLGDLRGAHAALADGLSLADGLAADEPQDRDVAAARDALLARAKEVDA